MKGSPLFYFISLVVLITGSSFYDHGDDIVNKQDSKKMEKIKLTINTQHFTATLLDNKAANAFKEILPLTIKMTELNGNEKYGDLKKPLPTTPAYPKTIVNGELMLYGSATLVLFYKSFPTTYSYTKLGQVDDVSGLASALGAHDVTVTFEHQ